MADTGSNSTIIEPQNGPSPRAVLLARGLLVLLGCAWVVAGVAVLWLFDDSSHWMAYLALASAIAHFLVARFAGPRVAVFLAVFGGP